MPTIKKCSACNSVIRKDTKKINGSWYCDIVCFNRTLKSAPQTVFEHKTLPICIVEENSSFGAARKSRGITKLELKIQNQKFRKSYPQTRLDFNK